MYGAYDLEGVGDNSLKDRFRDMDKIASLIKEPDVIVRLDAMTPISFDNPFATDVSFKQDMP